jgi:hypothetical protein
MHSIGRGHLGLQSRRGLVVQFLQGSERLPSAPISPISNRSQDIVYTGPKAIEAAANPISPPLRACGWWTA